MAENLSIKRNIIANYIGQGYAVLISFIMAPVYLSYMGTEAYGLIGFFTMASGLFQLLDLGLTPTVVRETALFRGGQISIGKLRVFMRGLEIIFGVVSTATAAVILLLTHQIATRWLKVGNLPINDVQVALAFMGVLVPVRWVAGLYRGMVVGFERMTWLASYNVIIATLRFVGVLAVFAAFGVNVKYFFGYQFVVGVIDLLGVLYMTRHLVGGNEGQREPFSWTPLRSNAAFSLTIAFVSTAWVLLTQTDKLVLSKVLPLAVFGIYSLAVSAALVINIINGPISQAVLPRMTKLFAEGRDDAVYRLYSDATQTVSVIIFPSVAALIFLAEPILRAWTGHGDIARQAAPILRLYAIGHGAAALGSFAYYIQYARGNLRLHFFGIAMMLIFLIPAFIWSGIHYGGIGTGASWAIANCFYLLVWVPIIHARFLKGRHWNWMFKDILPIAVPTNLLCWFISLVAPWPVGRLALVGYIVIIGTMLLLTSAANSSFVRRTVLNFVRRRLSTASETTS